MYVRFGNRPVFRRAFITKMDGIEMPFGAVGIRRRPGTELRNKVLTKTVSVTNKVYLTC